MFTHVCNLDVSLCFSSYVAKESIVHIDGTEKSLEQVRHWVQAIKIYTPASNAVGLGLRFSQVAAQIRRSWEKFTATPSREFEALD